jgi:uncharacterized protein YlxW (UPF0749 family)
MRRRRNQLTISAVAFALGLLAIVQLRTQQVSPGLGALSAQELTILVANLSTRNDELRTEVATLSGQLSQFQATQSRGQSSVDQIRADLTRLRAWAGLEPVTGTGVTVEVAGPIEGVAVQELINELRNAGSEAIALGGIRVVASTEVEGSAGALRVDGVALGASFEVKAIGSSEALTGSLTRVGGMVAQLAATNPGAVVTVTPVDRVDIPATYQVLVPTDGTPRL